MGGGIRERGSRATADLPIRRPILPSGARQGRAPEAICRDPHTRKGTAQGVSKVEAPAATKTAGYITPLWHLAPRLWRDRWLEVWLESYWPGFMLR